MNDLALIQKTHRPYVKAFIWGGIFLAILSIGFAVAYGQFSPEGFGRLFALTMISSAICGFQANRSKTPWSFWKVGGFYLVAAFVFLLLAAFGARNR